MKKFLTALSGLLFLAGIILVAGGCESECGGAIIGGCGCTAACMLIANYLDRAGALEDDSDEL